MPFYPLPSSPPHSPQALTMNANRAHLTALLRVAGGLAGLVVGGVLGALIMVAAMIFTGDSLGFDSIRPGVLVGACVGLILGLCYPRLVGKAFGELLSSL